MSPPSSVCYYLVRSWYIVKLHSSFFLLPFFFLSLYPGSDKLVSSHLPRLLGDGSLECRVEKDSEVEFAHSKSALLAQWRLPREGE